MRVGQLCEMFAGFAYPQEGQAVLTHAGRNRAGFRSPAEPPLRLSAWLFAAVKLPRGTLDDDCN